MSPGRRALSALAFAIILDPSAYAAVGVNKSFTPNSVVSTQSSTLTIVLLNPNAAAATGVALTDALPAGVVVTNPVVIGTNDCGFATGAIVAGSGSIPLSGGTIPARVGTTIGQCQVQVNVVSATPNTYLNTIAVGAVASSQGTNAQAAQATLVVSKPANVTGSKVFAPTNVHGGGTASTLTITLTNPNAVALTAAAVTDSLPAAITIAPTPNAGTTCVGGAATPSASATNPATIALAGGTIPANGSCTFFVDVVARNPNALTNGNQTNTIAAGALSTAEGATNSAISANLNVQTGASVAKAFSPTVIASGGTSNLTITVSNFNATILTPITFTDTFPVAAGMKATALPVSTCGGVIATVPAQPAPPPYTAFSITGGSLGGAGPAAGSTTCTITMPVTSTATGTNTLPANNYGGVAIAAASAALSVSAITGSKAFTTPALQTGSTTVTITLNNLTAAAATITSLSDNLTTMGTGFTVQAGATPSGTCGTTLTSPTPGTLITTTGGTIPANGSCTIILPIDIAPTATTGNRTNTIAASGVHTTVGNNLVTITGAVNVQRALTVTKAFAPATVQGGAPSRLTVTLAPTVNLTGAGFLDDLTSMGAGFVLLATGAGPNPVATNCGGGTVTANPGATTFSLAGATLTAGTNCTVAVNVATPASTGTFTDRILAANIVTTEGVTTSDVTANLVLVNNSVTVNKSFSPTTVAIGGVSTLSIQIRNNNAGAINLTGVGLTDTFPSGMVVASPPTASFSGSGCGGATITAPAGAASVILANANVNANSICTLALHVVGNTAGNLIDTIAPGSISSTQGVTNPLQGTATLAVTGTVNLTITKTDGTASAVPGTTTVYTLKVSNAGPNDVTGVVVSDPLPAGVTFTSWTCTATASSSCPASGSGPIAASVTIKNAGSVTFTINAAIASSATGSITNTASLTIPGSVINTNPVTSASDMDTLTPQVDLAITKNDGVASVIPGTSTTYTIVATNNGPSDVTGATVTDNLPAGISSATWTCTASAGSSCPPSGTNSIGATVNLKAGGTATFTLVAAVAPGAVGTLSNTASITAPAGVTETTPGNNSATDSDTLTPQADLAITKTDGVTSVNAGGSTVYTIVASNNGPSAVTGATVTDTAPAGLTLGSWTCAASAGSSCPASGSGNISAGVNLLVGGTATFTVNATIAGSATGSIANTASIGAPGGVTDPTPGNNSATDTDTVNAVADLAVTKTDGTTNATPGGSTTYTIVVTNSGPSGVVGATVADNLPASITSDSYTAVGGGGATGFTASGSGNIADTVNMPAGSSITYTLQANIASSATGSLANTATVTAPGSVTDPNPGNNIATDTDTLAPQVTLSVVKSDGSANYTPGGTAVYTITVTDTGPSDAANVTVSDPLPTGLTLTAAVNCVATGTANCGIVTGAISDTSFGATGASVAAGLGNSLVFTVPVAFDADLTTDPLVNTATATDVPTGATTSGSDSDALAPDVTLAVVKSDGSTTYTPGGSATYTVKITNGGMSDATNVTVTDALPAGVTLSANATCVASGAANCGTVTGLTGAASFGATGASIDAGAGNALTFTVPVAFAAGMTTDPLVNTATATDLLSGASGSGSDSDTRSAQVSLAVTKTDNSPSYTPGGTATYTVTVTNNGLTDALDVSVSDSLPAGVTLTGAVVCAPTGASCGTVTGASGDGSFSATGATIAAGAGNSLVFTVPVAFAANLADDPLVNAASATDQASGASGSDSDSDVRAAQATLAVTKTDGSATYTPGGAATYTIVVTNSGPSDAASVTVADPLPTGVTLSANATCVPAGSASCGTVTGATGDTSFGTTGAVIAAGTGNSLTFTAPASFAASMNADPLVNTVTVTDPASAPESASDSDSLSADVDLGITKTDGVTSALPGTSVTYTIVVTNAGPSDAINATVTDTLPTAISSATWTCVATGGGSCTASGTNDINDTVNVPVGATLTYTVVALIAENATGTLSNSPTVTAPAGATDTNPANNNANDTDTLTPQADLSITKTDGVTTVVQGASTIYTIVASNAGPSAVTGATVADTAPAGLTLGAWTCVASAGSSCPASGSGNISATVSLLSGGTATFTVNATVGIGAVGTIANTATIAAPAGVTDLNPANNSATDVDTVTVIGAANLTLAKSDGSTRYVPGGTATYTITVGNSGAATAGNVTVTDNLPTGLTLNGSPSCVASGTATCGALSGAAGGTTFSATGATIAAGGGNQLVYSLPVRFASSMTAPQVTNTATANDPVAGSTASASDTNLRGETKNAQPIPVDDPRALLALCGLIVLLAWRMHAATRPRHRER